MTCVENDPPSRVDPFPDSVTVPLSRGSRGSRGIRLQYFVVVADRAALSARRQSRQMRNVHDELALH